MIVGLFLVFPYFFLQGLPLTFKARALAVMLSAVLMLRHIDEDAAADRIMKALYDVLMKGTARTRDR